MKANCYIDGINCWDKYGVWITKGGYNDLLVFPALKEPEANDWPEEDGVEVDLSNPAIEDKEVAITFLASKSEIEAVDFINFLSSAGYRALSIPSLGRTWQLRLVSQPGNRIYASATPFTLRFAVDKPVRVTSGVYDPGMSIVESSYELDGIPFSDYGVIVDEARDSVMKSPVAKMNMSREVQTVDGTIYDADTLVFQQKEVVFKCRLKAASIAAFWNCYDAFFADLIQPGERNLFVNYTLEEYPVYYKRSSGFRIITLSGGLVMVEFSLALIFTVFRVSGTEYLLASEQDELIITEDGEYSIDLGYAD